MGSIFQQLGFNRIGLGIGAQIYSQIVIIGVQLIMLPLLLRAWGPGLYSAWVVLTSIPIYLSLSDFGFTFVAKNEMTMMVAAGDKKAALSVFHSVFSILTISCLLILAGWSFFIGPIPLNALFHFGSALSEPSAKSVLTYGLYGVLISQFQSLISAGIRCESGFAYELVWVASARLLESVFVCTAALTGFDLVATSLVGTSVRFAVTGAMYMWMRRHSNWLFLGVRATSMSQIRHMIHPSLSYALVTLAQASIIQGPIVGTGRGRYDGRCNYI